MPEALQTETPNAPSSEELNKAITEVATNAALGDSNIPLEVKVGAQVFRGDTPSGLIDELKKAQENATNLIRQQREELEQLRQQTQIIQQAQQTPTSEEEYNPQKAYDLFAKDPREYQKYMDRFDPVKAELQTTVEGFKRQSEIDKFKGSVGFNPSNEEALVFGQEFSRSGMEPNANNFELMFWRLVNQGKIRQPQITSMAPHQTPPPSFHTSASSPSTGIDMDQFARLPADQQAQVIERLKAAGY